MQFGKILLVGAAAFAMVLTVGCVTDEEDLEMFKVKPKQENSRDSNDNKSGKNGNNADLADGEAELKSGDDNGGNGDNGGNTGVSEWGKNSLSPYDDFGTPISGLTFETVYFRFDQSAIATSEYSKLDKIYSYLASNPGTGVVIEGHCDSKGSDEYNRALGERRALAAKDYLLGKGIADSRIRTVSYGEEKPAASNDSDDTRAKNRRDEFIGVTLKR